MPCSSSGKPVATPRTLLIDSAQKIGQSAKLDLLMELVPELLEEGRRILVFSQFTRMIALIEDELNRLSIGYSKLTGQTQDRGRCHRIIQKRGGRCVPDQPQSRWHRLKPDGSRYGNYL